MHYLLQEIIGAEDEEVHRFSFRDFIFKKITCYYLELWKKYCGIYFHFENYQGHSSQFECVRNNIGFKRLARVEYRNEGEYLNYIDAYEFNQHGAAFVNSPLNILYENLTVGECLNVMGKDLLSEKFEYYYGDNDEFFLTLECIKVFPYKQDYKDLGVNVGTLPVKITQKLYRN